MSWSQYCLADIIHIKHGYAFKGEFFSEEPTDDILLTPGNFSIGGGFKANKLKYYNGEFPVDYILDENDVIVTMTDLSKEADTLGFSAKVPAWNGKRFLHNQRIGLVSLKNDEFDINFLYWLMRSYSYQKFVANGATGATVKHTSPTKICQFTFTAPKDKNTQRSIASILSAYDNLIENNLKRIKLLEEKAFLSYKSFVKNERVKEKKLNQVTQFLKRGISPKYVNEDGVIVLNQKCIRNHIVSFEDSRLTDSEKNIPEERMLQKFDTLINSTGTGTLGRIAMNIQDEFPLTADSHVTIVRPNHEITPIYLCMSLFAKENVIEMMGEGATNQTELSPKKVGEEIKIPMISSTLMNQFEKENEPVFNLVWNLQKQNTKLRDARDILLPRLMSREIEV